MCTTSYDCNVRLQMNKRFLKPNAFDYKIKVIRQEAFIVINNDLFTELSTNNKIEKLNIKTKNSENYVCSIKWYPEVLLLHITGGKYILVDNSNSVYNLLSEHSYTSPLSVQRFAKHLKKPDATNDIHHRMETFDNREAALELAPKDHVNNGSHQVEVSFANGLAAFDTFTNYIQYTGNWCHNCHITSANSRVKYIQEL